MAAADKATASIRCVGVRIDEALKGRTSRNGFELSVASGHGHRRPTSESQANNLSRTQAATGTGQEFPARR